MRVAVIGGGAAGYFSSIQIKEFNPSFDVSLFEATNKVLSKVLISGGGRCNVTNNTQDVRELVKNYPRGEKELIGPFNQFGPSDTISWFESKGVKLKTEDDRRVFPVTNNSESIANALVDCAKGYKINIRKNSRVDYVEPNESSANGFFLCFKNSEREFYDKVVIACGGIKKQSSLFSKLRHKIIDPVPSLFSFEINDQLIEGLLGISIREVDAKLSFSSEKVNSKYVVESKPLLITHWGLSGPAVIVLSSHYARELYDVSYQAKLTLNFLPKNKPSEVKSMLLDMKSKSPKKKLYSSKVFDLPSALWSRFLDASKIDKDLLWANLSIREAEVISENLTKYEFQIIGKGQFKEEFVTSGGVSLKEVDFKTMQSKLHPGLYFCGEVLDIDGVTGGFNFQAAWTTGYLVGRGM